MFAPPSPLRRRFLSGAGALLSATALAPLAPARAWAEAHGGSTRVLRLHNVHTAESGVFPFFQAGSRAPEVLARLQHFFRDFRTGHEHPLDNGLFDLLHEVAVTLDRDPEYEVICGYRSPQTNEYLRGRSASSGVAQHSLHLEGRAVDVRMVGVSVERLHTAGLSLQRGGVGLYTASQFVHLDTGRVRHWGS
jgi:uncharacterized protein YcbK (DUF882 family)